jgi:hypothetical protein
MGTLADTRHLELHGGQWRVVVRVPRHLVAVLGKTVLKRGLRTDSLKVAQSRRWEVRAALNRVIRLASDKSNSAPLDPITEEALKQRDYRSRLNDPEALSLIDEIIHWCQSAPNFDPGSACNLDPFRPSSLRRPRP